MCKGDQKREGGLGKSNKQAKNATTNQGKSRNIQGVVILGSVEFRAFSASGRSILDISE